MHRITRLLLAAALGGGVLLFASASPAGASEETIGGCVVEELVHAAEEAGLEELHLAGGTEEAVHELEEALGEEGFEELDENAEDCLDAPNPLLPETNEIIWGAIGFVIVFVILAKFGFPAIKTAMEERTAKIQSDVDAAEQAKADAEGVKAEYEGRLAEARTEAAQIIEEARQAADQFRSDQQSRLNEELAQARAAAQSDIDAAKARAMDELRSEVSDIAIGAAESVVGANLDHDAQLRLIEDYINRVQSSGQG